MQSSDEGTTAIIRLNTLEENARYGMYVVGSWALVMENTARKNGDNGIFLGVGRVINNISILNGGYGLRFLNSIGGYTGNLLFGNGVGPVVSGINMGQNICGNLANSGACPGAVY